MNQNKKNKPNNNDNNNNNETLNRNAQKQKNATKMINIDDINYLLVKTFTPALQRYLLYA